METGLTAAQKEQYLHLGKGTALLKNSQNQAAILDDEYDTTA